MPSRPLLVACLFVVLGTLLGLVVGEVAIRTLTPDRSAFELRGLHRFRPDLPWLYELRPGAQGRLSETGSASYRISADGLRDAIHVRPKPPGVFRVVVLGDSIAFGYGVEQEEAFPQLLEQRLARLAPDSGIEVVNLGVGGYNAYNEEKLLEGVGRSYEPDLVLVQFCINDLNDPTLHFDAQTRLALSAIPDAAFPDPARRSGSEHHASRVLGWCRISKLCAAAHDTWLVLNAPEFDDADRQDAVRLVGAGDLPEWRWLETRYLEMARVAEESGAAFAILAFPFRKQLETPAPDPVQEQLAGLAQRHGWAIVDPLPAFREAQRPLFLDWWHPTAAAHRIAAAETARALACGGLVGAEAQGICLRTTQ